MLAGAVALAVVLAGQVSGSRPLPPLLLLLGCTATYAVGRLTGRNPVLRTAVPGLVAVGIVAALLLAPDGTSGRPLAGPLGYGNANGALCLVGAGATVLTVAGLPRRWLPLATLAVIPTVLAGVTGSKAATALSLLIVLSALLLRRQKRSRNVILAALALPVVVLAATMLLGSSYEPGFVRSSVVDRVVDKGLSERRVQLWSESLVLLQDNPWAGVGPGRFATTAPTAISDPDARWSHSLVLQQAAETGWFGGAALVGLLAWAGAGLYRGASRDGRALVGAVLFGAVLSQASIDYVTHFAAVPLLAVLLVGSASQRLAAPSQRRTAQAGPGADDEGSSVPLSRNVGGTE